MQTMKESIETVKKAIEGLQVKANAKNMTMDFEGCLINLETNITKAEWYEDQNDK